MAKSIKINKDELTKNVNVISSNWKTILTVSGVIAGVYLIYKTTTSLKDALPNFNDDPNAGGGNLDPSNTDVPYGATITKNQAEAIAAGLFEAMDRMGTDEAKIFSLLQGKNGVDYAMISKAFGTPRYNGFTSAAYLYPKRNLTYWLSSELSSYEFEKLKKLINNAF